MLYFVLLFFFPSYSQNINHQNVSDFVLQYLCFNAESSVRKLSNHTAADCFDLKQEFSTFSSTWPN